MKFRDLVPWNTRGEKNVPVENATSSVQALQHNMNRMFEDFFTGFSQTPFAPFFSNEDSFSPKVDVEEAENRITVTAEVPGLEEKDIHLTMKDDHLVLEGERKREEERTEEGTRYFESSYGSFRRVIPFSSEIDADAVEAKMNKGLLTVILPKVESSTSSARKISIRPE